MQFLRSLSCLYFKHQRVRNRYPFICMKYFFTDPTLLKTFQSTWRSGLKSWVRPPRVSTRPSSGATSCLPSSTTTGQRLPRATTSPTYTTQGWQPGSGLLTNSHFFCFLFCKKNHWFALGNFILFCSSQQLPCLCLGPLEGFLSWHGALQWLSICLVRCYRNYRDTRTPSVILC